MPDRAVVSELCCETPDIAMWYGDDDQQQFYCRNCKSPFPPVEPPPRALVAISEDRQWLVVHRPKEGRFLVYEEFHFDSGQACYGEHGGTDDTGQSAEDVLAAWLEEGQG